MPLYAEVIPIRRLPRHLGVFDYRIPEGMGVRPGQVVTVPFRRQPLQALVWRVKDVPAAGVPVDRIQAISAVHEHAEIAPVLQAVLHFVADYYLQSPASVANLLLPLPQRAALPAPSVLSGVCHLYVGAQTPSAWVPVVQSTLQAKRQVLILCPEVSGVEAVIAQLHAHVDPGVVALHSRLTRLQQVRALQAAASTGRVVVGTRMAVFASFRALGQIVVTDEHREGYKQWDQNPRYHALTVARRLAMASGAGLTVASVWPNLTTLQLARRQGWQIHTLPSPRAAVTIADLKEERRSGNRGLLSGPLQQALTQLDADPAAPRPLWVLANRRSDAVATRCRDCSSALRCPTCGTNLRLDASSQRLTCVGCGAVVPRPTTCPRCGGSRWYQPELTVDGISRQIRGHYPRLRVATFDASLRPAAVDAVVAASHAGTTDVLVGTVALLQAALPRPPIAVFVSFDASLNLADVRAAERTAQLLAELRSRASEVVVQTSTPTHPLLDGSTEYATWAEGELEARRMLGYPPYARLISLVVGGDTADAAEADATEVKRNVQAVVAPTGFRLEVLGPVTPAKAVVRRRHRRHLILKLIPDDPSLLDEPLPEGPLVELLRRLPGHITVDVDPLELT